MERSEAHEGKHLFFYSTHKQHLEAPKEYMRVSEIKEIIARHVEGFNAAETLVLEERGDHPDKLLNDEAAEVHIHEIPHFHSESHLKEFRISVNTDPKVVDKRVLTFSEVVNLAFSDTQNFDYSISYKRAVSLPHDGNLFEHGRVKIKNGTDFHVTPTRKS